MKRILCAGRSSVAYSHVGSRSKLNIIVPKGRVGARKCNKYSLYCHAREHESLDCGLSADLPTPKRPSVGATELPTQGDSVVAGIDPIDYINKQLQDILKPPSTEDYLAVSAAFIMPFGEDPTMSVSLF